jgi:hypothetical protein
MVQERQPTLWERIGGFLQRLYRLVLERLPLFVRGFLTFRKKKYIN